MTDKPMIIGGNGTEGSNTHRVFKQQYDDKSCTYQNMGSFSALFQALVDRRVDQIIVPVRNVIIGSVAEVKKVMAGLDQTGVRLKQHGEEIALQIHHALIGGTSASLETVQEAHSYTAALDQCKENIAEMGLKPVYHPDTYGAAVDIMAENNPKKAAIAPVEAVNDLNGVLLREEMSDIVPNLTFFRLFSLEK